MFRPGWGTALVGSRRSDRFARTRRDRVERAVVGAVKANRRIIFGGRMAPEGPIVVAKHPVFTGRTVLVGRETRRAVIYRWATVWWGEAPEGPIAIAKQPVFTGRTVLIGRETRRAVIYRWATARRAQGPSNIIRLAEPIASRSRHGLSGASPHQVDTPPT